VCVCVCVRARKCLKYYSSVLHCSSLEYVCRILALLSLCHYDCLDEVLFTHTHLPFRMDSVSGSLRDSEPTSPTSPASPDPLGSKALKATSPIALTQALSSLQSDPAALLRGILLYYCYFSPSHFQLKLVSNNRHVAVRPTCISAHILECK